MNKTLPAFRIGSLRHLGKALKFCSLTIGALAWLVPSIAGAAGTESGTWVFSGSPYSPVPGELTVPAVPFIKATAGRYHSVALQQDGSVVAWGDNFYGQTTVPVAARSSVTAIAASWDYSLALKQDGSVVAWGGDNHGQTTVPAAAQSGVGKMMGSMTSATFFRLGSPLDQDGDGLSDAAESQMAALGFNPVVNQPELVSALNAGAASVGLYTSVQIQALHLGQTLIPLNLATGKVKLTLDWKKSTNLTNSADFPASPAAVSVNGSGDIEFEFSPTVRAAFFRLDVE